MRYRLGCDFRPLWPRVLRLIPQKPESPGRDYAPLLRGQKFGQWNQAVFYDFLNVRAIRTDE